MESNDKLIKNGVLVKHTYELYPVHMQDTKVSRRENIDGFVTYLIRAIVAKGNIGK